MVLHELANALIFQGEIKEFVENLFPSRLQVKTICKSGLDGWYYVY